MTAQEEKYEPLRLRNQLCYPIYLCSKEIARKYGELLEDLDLTYTQCIVMMYFWEIGSSNVKSLGRALMLDPSTLTPLLKKLEAKGYLRRERSETDERSLTVSLTEKGEKIKDEVLRAHDAMCENLGLNEREAESLSRLTAKILANIGG